MAKGLMEATKLVQLDKLRVQSMRNLLETTRNQKPLNYSTQKTLKDFYQVLLEKP